MPNAQNSAAKHIAQQRSAKSRKTQLNKTVVGFTVGLIETGAE